MSAGLQSNAGTAGPFAHCGKDCRSTGEGETCSLHARRSCLIRATLTDERGHDFAAIIHNVSERCMGVTCKGGRPSEGRAVSIALSDGQVLAGRVTLVRDDYCDIELERDLDLAMFSDIARHRQQFLRDDAEWGITAGHRVHIAGLDPERTREI